eukprot:752692-Pleurochrysis_carterae.AAC.1
MPINGAWADFKGLASVLACHAVGAARRSSFLLSRRASHVVPASRPIASMTATSESATAPHT